MMALSRLDGQTFYLNPILVETVEATPDTVILLTSGHRYVVRDPLENVLRTWEAAMGGVHAGMAALSHLTAAKGESDG
jgi:flagellar protein FlbD